MSASFSQPHNANPTKNDKKTKFQSLNINSIFKGKGLESQRSTKSYGYQNIAKVTSSKRIPPPVLLPSKPDNQNNDISLTTSGTSWAHKENYEDENKIVPKDNILKTWNTYLATDAQSITNHTLNLNYSIVFQKEFPSLSNEIKNNEIGESSPIYHEKLKRYGSESELNQNLSYQHLKPQTNWKDNKKPNMMSAYNEHPLDTYEHQYLSNNYEEPLFDEAMLAKKEIVKKYGLIDATRFRVKNIVKYEDSLNYNGHLIPSQFGPNNMNGYKPEMPPQVQMMVTHQSEKEISYNYHPYSHPRPDSYMYNNPVPNEEIYNESKHLHFSQQPIYPPQNYAYDRHYDQYDMKNMAYSYPPHQPYNQPTVNQAKHYMRYMPTQHPHLPSDSYDNADYPPYHHETWAMQGNYAVGPRKILKSPSKSYNRQHPNVSLNQHPRRYPMHVDYNYMARPNSISSHPCEEEEENEEYYSDDNNNTHQHNYYHHHQPQQQHAQRQKRFSTNNLLPNNECNEDERYMTHSPNFIPQNQDYRLNDAENNTDYDAHEKDDYNDRKETHYSHTKGLEEFKSASLTNSYTNKFKWIIEGDKIVKVPLSYEPEPSFCQLPPSEKFNKVDKFSNLEPPSLKFKNSQAHDHGIKETNDHGTEKRNINNNFNYPQNKQHEKPRNLSTSEARNKPNTFNTSRAGASPQASQNNSNNVVKDTVPAGFKFIPYTDLKSLKSKNVDVKRPAKQDTNKQADLKKSFLTRQENVDRQQGPSLKRDIVNDETDKPTFTSIKEFAMNIKKEVERERATKNKLESSTMNLKQSLDYHQGKSIKSTKEKTFSSSSSLNKNKSADFTYKNEGSAKKDAADIFLYDKESDFNKDRKQQRNVKENKSIKQLIKELDSGRAKPTNSGDLKEFSQLSLNKTKDAPYNLKYAKSYYPYKSGYSKTNVSQIGTITSHAPTTSTFSGPIKISSPHSSVCSPSGWPHEDHEWETASESSDKAIMTTSVTVTTFGSHTSNSLNDTSNFTNSRPFTQSDKTDSTGNINFNQLLLQSFNGNSSLLNDSFVTNDPLSRFKSHPLSSEATLYNNNTNNPHTPAKLDAISRFHRLPQTQVDSYSQLHLSKSTDKDFTSCASFSFTSPATVFTATSSSSSIPGINSGFIANQTASTHNSLGSNSYWNTWGNIGKVSNPQENDNNGAKNGNCFKDIGWNTSNLFGNINPLDNFKDTDNLDKELAKKNLRANGNLKKDYDLDTWSNLSFNHQNNQDTNWGKRFLAEKEGNDRLDVKDRKVGIILPSKAPSNHDVMNCSKLWPPHLNLGFNNTSVTNNTSSSNNEPCLNGIKENDIDVYKLIRQTMNPAEISSMIPNSSNMIDQAAVAAAILPPPTLGANMGQLTNTNNSGPANPEINHHQQQMMIQILAAANMLNIATLAHHQQISGAAAAAGNSHQQAMAVTPSSFNAPLANVISRSFGAATASNNLFTTQQGTLPPPPPPPHHHHLHQSSGNMLPLLPPPPNMARPLGGQQPQHSHQNSHLTLYPPPPPPPPAHVPLPPPPSALMHHQSMNLTNNPNQLLNIFQESITNNSASSPSSNQQHQQHALMMPQYNANISGNSLSSQAHHILAYMSSQVNSIASVGTPPITPNDLIWINPSTIVPPLNNVNVVTTEPIQPKFLQP